jgi:hypothetical protein
MIITASVWNRYANSRLQISQITLVKILGHEADEEIERGNWLIGSLWVLIHNKLVALVRTKQGQVPQHAPQVRV